MAWRRRDGGGQTEVERVAVEDDTLGETLPASLNRGAKRV